MCILKSLSEEASIPHMVQEGMVTEERCQTADFLFFDDKVDAKKTDNNVVKVKGCLIHVHQQPVILWPNLQLMQVAPSG